MHRLRHGNRPDFGDGLATSGHPPLGQLMGGLAATAFSFVILYMFGALDWPQDLPLFLIGII